MNWSLVIKLPVEKKARTSKNKELFFPVFPCNDSPSDEIM